MQTRRPLIVLLLLAIASVDLVVASLVMQPGPWVLRSGASRCVFMAMVCAQVSLAATWLGLARRPVPWPATAAVVTVVLLAVFLANPPFRGVPGWLEGGGWLTIFSTQTIAVAAPFWMARAAGLRVVAPSEIERAAAAAAGRPVQFSIAYLLGWMTALAIVLGLGQFAIRRYLPSLSHSLWSRQDFWVGLVCVSVGNAAIAWPAPWAVLGVRRRKAGILLLCLATGGVVAVWGLLLSGGVANCLRLAVFCVPQVALLVAVLGVFRVAGYRLVRS